MIYTLTLNPALDYDVYTERLNLGELNLADEVNFRAGGKGINVSIMLKNLRENSIALGFVAGFTGQYILEDLEKKDIKTDFIEVEGLTRINIKVNDKLSETEITGISPKINEKDIEKLEKYVSELKEEDILILAGSIPSSLEKNIYYKLSKITKAKVILDTRGNLLKENLYNNILIKPNIKELEDVFGVEIKTELDVYKYASYFIEKGVENVLVSMGEKGAILVKKGKYFKGNVPKGEYINSIGSGDSMVAGFAYSYLKNMRDLEKLKLAIACGSATAYSYGIGDFEVINKLIDKIEIKEVIL